MFKKKDIEQKSEPNHLVEWKQVGENTYRYRIPEVGWLVKLMVRNFKATEFGGSVSFTEGSICFVPDPEGSWI
jgi:hypothetical protein